MAKFDESCGWNYAVHRHLGEILAYYFVKVDLYDRTRIKMKLEKMLSDHNLGSVRVFEIFGNYDLIIRAWIYPSIEQKFREWLQEALPYRLIHIFQSTDSDVRWYPKADKRAVELITQETIQRAQDLSLDLDRLESLALVTRKTPGNGKNLVRFFVAVYFEGAGQQLFLEDGASYSREVENKIREVATIRDYTIDRGFGFCQMLIKGEAEDYFSIADVPSWISTHYKSLRARTETFLVHRRGHLVGGEKIGLSTFRAIGGKDIFANSIVPQMYDNDRVTPYSPDKIEWVKRHLTKVRGVAQDTLELSDKDRALLESCMISYLEGDPSIATKALFGVFSDMEAFLRRTYKELLFSKLRLDRDRLLLAARVDSKNLKYLSLGDVLRLLHEGAKELNHNDFGPPKGFEQIVELRNKVMHGDFSVEDFTPDTARLIVVLRNTLGRIATALGTEYTGD